MAGSRSRRHRRSSFTTGTWLGTGRAPTPDDAADFVRAYETAREHRFGASDRMLAAAAVRWSMAYNARCGVTNADGGMAPPGSALDLLDARRADYLNLSW